MCGRGWNEWMKNLGVVGEEEMVVLCGVVTRSHGLV
jgi:hypothetical protein